MENIKSIFNEDTIEYYKTHKDEITSELLTTLRMSGNEGKQIALDILDTEMDDCNYYLDAFGKRISHNGDRELKKAHTQMKLSPIHIEELKKCAADLNYFRENYVKIRTPKGINFPELRDYQNGFLQALLSDYESIVSLQPRQSGKSVTTAIYLVWEFNFSNDKNIGICANKSKLAREFLNNIADIFRNLPMWMKVGVSVWNTMSLRSENNMRVLTDSPSSGPFRGFTIHILVVDETAFINPSIFQAFIDSVGPSQSALTWKKNIFISTANGMNHFYKMVMEAKKRKKLTDLDADSYNKIKEKYKVLEEELLPNGLYDVTIDEPSNGYLLYEVDWRDVPRYNSKGERLTPEEFKDNVVSKYGLIYFNQNFGNHFLGSSYTLIDASVLGNFVSKETDIVYDNYLHVLETPEKKHKYIMGVDPAKGSLDAFAVQIIDITSLPFKQVASAQVYKCNYQLMPEFLNEWGNRFNKAFMIIENNEGAGTFVANMLMNEYEYENLYVNQGNYTHIEPGFRTSAKTRNQILDTLKLFADNLKLEIFDERTISELNTFVIKDNKYQADDGCHDDLVMSLALCFVPFIDSKNFDNMKDLVGKIYSSDSTDIDVSDYMVIGDFDDYSEEESEVGKSYDGKSFITGVYYT